jgi:3-oxoacyl-[acyl-carrier-protein] synthase-3
VKVPTGGHFSQDGRAVQGFAIRRAVSTLEEVRRHSSGNPAALHFISHQANLLMLQAVGDRCGIDESRHYHNVEYFGNTAAAGAPSVLSQKWDSFQPGDEVALVVVGSGLSWGGMLIQFTDRVQ